MYKSDTQLRFPPLPAHDPKQASDCLLEMNALEGTERTDISLADVRQTPLRVV